MKSLKKIHSFFKSLSKGALKVIGMELSEKKSNIFAIFLEFVSLMSILTLIKGLFD